MPAMPDAGGASPAPTIRPQSPSPDAPPLSASPDERSEVERYTHLLNHLCETQQVPNEFWPHHGSLSKEIREETEAALKQKERTATAICTTTLKRGIDIAAVKSAAKIGPPPTVASLRQRPGHTDRQKAEPANPRGYCV